jgi:hypothetical protein
MEHDQPAAPLDAQMQRQMLIQRPAFSTGELVDFAISVEDFTEVSRATADVTYYI